MYSRMLDYYQDYLINCFVNYQEVSARLVP